MTSLLEIVLYDKDDEVAGRFERRYVPFKTLKPAIEIALRLQEAGIDPDDLADLRNLEDLPDAALDLFDTILDDLADLVVEAFGRKFTRFDLDGGSDSGEMMSVLRLILGRAKKPQATPVLKLVLYGEQATLDRAFVRPFVPWKLLKRAVRLFKRLSQAGSGVNGLTPALVDELAGLVVEAFGERFSLEELNERGDLGEVMDALYTVVSKATGKAANPTPPE